MFGIVLGEIVRVLGSRFTVHTFWLEELSEWFFEQERTGGV